MRVIVAEALREAEAGDIPDAEWCERVNLVLDHSEMSLRAASVSVVSEADHLSTSS
jgi:hypothetical protein